jgi:AcrR family transcriptional regulator
MKEEKKEVNRKQKVLDVAAKLFTERGFEGTSMRLIAEKVGISKPAIYYYFPDKKALFEALLRSAMDRSDKILEEIYNSDITPVMKLYKIVNLRFESFKKHVNLARVISNIVNGSIRCSVSIDFEKWFNKQYKIMEDIIKDAINDGTFRKDISKQSLIFCLIGGTNLHIRNYFITKDKEISENTAKDIMNTLLRGALANKKMEII